MNNFKRRSQAISKELIAFGEKGGMTLQFSGAFSVSGAISHCSLGYGTPAFDCCLHPPASSNATLCPLKANRILHAAERQVLATLGLDVQGRQQTTDVAFTGMGRYKPVRHALDILLYQDALETVLQKTPAAIDSRGVAGGSEHFTPFIFTSPA